MSQVLILQVDNEIIQEFSGHRIGKDVTIKLFRKVVYVLNDCIINSCIVCRLASGSLFKYFAHETGEINAFERFALLEMIDVVLPRLAGLDQRT